MIEMTFSGLHTCQMDRQPLMLLRQKAGDAYLPIVIGPYEAQAISLGSQKVSTPRPMSHDLMRNLLQHLGARVSAIHINDFRDGTFYARIIIEANGRQAEVDSRPSDAVALAVRLGTPIFAEEWIIEEAGFLKKSDEGEAPDGHAREGEARLAVFRDFINSLDLDDLDPKR